MAQHSSRTTQDHDEIRQWAEARGAKPAEVASTERGGKTGMIRLEFPDAPHHNDGALKEISWDDFFEKFDANGLALTYQEQTADGKQSNFNKLIYPEDDKSSSSKSGSESTKSSASTSSSHKKPPSKQHAASSHSKTARHGS